jgi:hypothetical protein
MAKGGSKTQEQKKVEVAAMLDRGYDFVDRRNENAKIDREYEMLERQAEGDALEKRSLERKQLREFIVNQELK